MWFWCGSDPLQVQKPAATSGDLHLFWSLLTAWLQLWSALTPLTRWAKASLVLSIFLGIRSLLDIWNAEPRRRPAAACADLQGTGMFLWNLLSLQHRHHDGRIPASSSYWWKPLYCTVLYSVLYCVLCTVLYCVQWWLHVGTYLFIFRLSKLQASSNCM